MKFWEDQYFRASSREDQAFILLLVLMEKDWAWCLKCQDKNSVGSNDKLNQEYCFVDIFLIEILYTGSYYRKNRMKLLKLKPVLPCFPWKKGGLPELTQGKVSIARQNAGHGSGEDLECTEEASCTTTIFLCPYLFIPMSSFRAYWIIGNSLAGY